MYEFDDKLDGLLWYLDVASRSFPALISFRPPADLKEMRRHYGLYFQNKFAALDVASDLLREVNPDFLKSFAVAFPDFPYVRQLRHAIVHRGSAIVNRGTVHEGVVIPLCPSLSNEHRTQHFRSSYPLMLELAARFEAVVNGAIWEAFQAHPQLWAPVMPSHEEILRAIEQDETIPGEVKASLPSLLANMDALKVHAEAKAARSRELGALLGQPPEAPA